MKKLDVTPITTSIAMPIKAGTLQFLQDAHKEALNALIKNVVQDPLTDTIYILSGCVNSGTLPVHTISPGTLYVNDEIYDFAGATFTLTGLNKAYARIETTQYTAIADPVEFTDGVSRNVHNIRKIVIEATTVSSLLPEFKDFVSSGAWLKGDTKEVVCDAAYLTKNFDSSGLGRLDRKGWAIMNGANGTVNDNGKVIIAYGTSYTTLGATGGSEDAVVVSHRHDLLTETLSADGTSQFGDAFSVTGDGPFATPVTHQTEISGVSGTGKNMQPYAVRLRIQKI